MFMTAYTRSRRYYVTGFAIRDEFLKALRGQLLRRAHCHVGLRAMIAWRADVYRRARRSSHVCYTPFTSLKRQFLFATHEPHHAARKRAMLTRPLMISWAIGQDRRPPTPPRRDADARQLPASSHHGLRDTAHGRFSAFTCLHTHFR